MTIYKLFGPYKNLSATKVILLTALKGSEKATHPKKKINFDTVQRQLNAGVPFTAIAASQKVSEGTLRRRMKEKDMYKL